MPRARTDAPPRLPRRPPLATTLRAVEGQLVGAALTAGLAFARPRSSPDRLGWEARRFLALLQLALPRNGAAALGKAVEIEARRGAFACADSAGAATVLALWERVIRSFAEGHRDLVDGSRLDRALQRIATLLEPAMRRAAGHPDVAVIGGSAGGLAAVAELLRAMHSRIPATLVVVLHTHADSPMMVPLVLSRVTTMHLSYPTEGGALLLGHAYIAPPSLHLGIHRGRLHLTRTARVRYSRPSIDVLFASAAVELGRRVVSVVLSGTGRDGADGTVAVREHGGTTFAQLPEDAQFGAMPQAAIATGAVQSVDEMSRLRTQVARVLNGGGRAARSRS